MERDLFVDAEAKAWWLLGDDLDAQTEERRQALGETFGWTDPNWFSVKANLEIIFDFLQPGQDKLLRDLDEVTNDVGQREWLDQLLLIRAPAEGEVEAPEVEVEAEAADEAEETPPAPPVSEAPKKSSIFKSKAAEQEESETATEAESESAPETPSAPVAETPSAPVAETEEESQPEAETEEVPPPPTPEEIQDLIADPEVPVSAEEVEKAMEDPDFEAKLAAAEAALEAELEGESEAELEAEMAESES